MVLGDGQGELIAALATAPGPAAIAVLRLSGLGAMNAARTFLVGLPVDLPPRQLTRAVAVQGGGEPLDDVLVVHFPAPRSYTGEEVVEVHGHGGLAVAQALEAQALVAGARRARAGEFTERAVAHGKMDVLEAEALAALLEADDPDGLRAALAAGSQVGKLRVLAVSARQTLVEAIGSADYPRETEGLPLGWRDGLLRLKEELASWLGGIPLDAALRDGITVALIGPPNAGKSSIFNYLIDDERALVDPAPGTTRDAQPAGLFLSGRRFTIVDTAGIRDATGLEARGVARALAISREAQMRLWIEDRSAPPSDPPDGMQIQLRVLAKGDLPLHPDRAGPGDKMALTVSASTGEGMDGLRKEIEQLGRVAAGPLSGRQRRLMAQAERALIEASLALDDVAADRLAIAVGALEELIGVRNREWIDTSEVYARFCVGK